MNRAERRRQERSGVSEAAIRERDRKEAYDAGYKAGMQSVVEITFYMTAYTLSYKTGYSKARLRELMGYIYNNIDSFRTGQLEPQDFDTIVEEMKGKYGIKLT